MKKSRFHSFFLVAIALLIGGTAHLTAQYKKPPFGPWKPLHDGRQNGVEIAFQMYSDGTQYYKLLNTYLETVTVHCSFKYTDRNCNTKPGGSCMATLTKGQEESSGGWWDANVASVDDSSLTATVTFANSSNSDKYTNGVNTVEFPGYPSDKDAEKGPEWKKYAVNQPLHLADGTLTLRVNKFVYSRHEESKCTNFPKVYAVYSNYSSFSVTVHNDIITASQGNAGPQEFLGCSTTKN